jgi:type VI secretion system protein ImpJ
LALRSVNRYIPLLYHLTESEEIHPWTTYALLRQLIGELSSFSDQISAIGETDDGVPRLLSYDHRNLWECFSGAQALITELLDSVTAGPEHIIQLVYDGTYYAADLPSGLSEGRNRFYLVFQTEEDPKRVLESIDKIAKLSSRQVLPLLIARALPGIRLEHLPAPPQELPRRARSIYFQIDHHDEQWERMQKDHNIGLYWDDAPKDLTIEFMVVGRT